MTDTYVFFDFEMPSSCSGRISAVGVTVLSNGSVTDSFYSLVNPECEFEEYIIKLTGISPELVKDAPTFDQLWEKLKGYLEAGILVAHAAEGDLHALAQCLNAYHIVWKPVVPYLCTARACREVFPELKRSGLDFLCGELGVELNHHHADSDSLAAAKLFIKCLQQGYEPQKHIRMYDLEHAKKQKQNKQKKSIQQINDALCSMAKPKYIETQKTLFPLADVNRLMGIPVPVLRRYASSIAKTTQASVFLSSLPHTYFEEDILHAFLLNFTTDGKSCREQLAAFLPLIKETAILNLLHPRAFRLFPDQIYPQLLIWQKSSSPNEAVFALYMLTELFTERRFDIELLKSLFYTEFLSSAHQKAAVSYLLKSAVFHFDSVSAVLSTVPADHELLTALKQAAVKSKLLTHEQKSEIISTAKE